MLQSIPADRIEQLRARDPFVVEHIEELASHPGVYQAFLALPYDNPLFEPTPWFDLPRRTAFPDDEAWGVAMRTAFWRNEQESRHLYGVADNLEQILTRMPWLNTDPQCYALEGRLVTREHNPDWRWHKHGHYLGDFTDLAEHLGDSDPAITSLVTFTVHQHR